MGFWTSNPHKADAELVDSLSHSPSGGRLKAWLLGVGLALVPIIYSVHCLQTGQAKFLFGRGTRLVLTGSSGVAMALAYMAVGVFIHAHWFWGLHPKLEAFSPVLKVLALLVFLCGLGYATYKILGL